LTFPFTFIVVIMKEVVKTTNEAGRGGSTV